MDFKLDMKIFQTVILNSQVNLSSYKEEVLRELEQEKPIKSFDSIRYQLSDIVSADYVINYNNDLELSDTELVVDFDEIGGSEEYDIVDEMDFDTEEVDNVRSRCIINPETSPLSIDRIHEINEAYSKFLDSELEEFNGNIAELEERINNLIVEDDEEVIDFDNDIGDAEYDIEDEIAVNVDDNIEMEDCIIDLSDMNTVSNKGYSDNNEDDDINEEYNLDDDIDDSYPSDDNNEDEYDDYSEEYDEYTEENDEYEDEDDEYSDEDEYEEIDEYTDEDEEEYSEEIDEYSDEDEYDDNDTDNEIDEYEDDDEYEDNTEEDDYLDEEDDNDDENEEEIDEYSDEEEYDDNTEDYFEEDTSNKGVDEQKTESSSEVETDTLDSDSVDDFEPEFIDIDITKEEKSNTEIKKEVVKEIVKEVKKEETVKEEEPKDLIQFIRKHPRCEVSFALQYFSKKEIEKNIMMGRIIKKGNKLYF